MPADTRIIAATKKNLVELVKEKRLREDLYYRLCGIEIKMPPLRERVEDIPLLAIHFLKKASARQKDEKSPAPFFGSSGYADDLCLAGKCTRARTGAFRRNGALRRGLNRPR